VAVLRREDDGAGKVDLGLVERGACGIDLRGRALPLRPQHGELLVDRGGLIAVVVSIATFMLVLDTSIANVALVNIAGDLAVGVDEATHVDVFGVAAAFAALMIPLALLLLRRVDTGATPAVH
jgi:hypothetical protein